MKHDQKKLSNTHFDKDATEYDKSAKYAPVRARYPYIVDEALRYQFQSWLDVGCGTGALLSMVAEQRKDVQLFGIDLSEEMTKVARARLGKKADLRVSDSERLPFGDEKFDLITCTFSFHHYLNPKVVLIEMERVLSPQGKLIVVDPLLFTPLRQIINLVAPLREEGAVRFISKNRMYSLAKSAGLEVSKWSRLDRFYYLMVAEKIQK
ncbi:MAG: class I SAM-dependent methyltransferase [Spirochaetia bacterium]|jgi:ubiquinone/menaquinone biosynthesis C-methylase UbiE